MLKHHKLIPIPAGGPAIPIHIGMSAVVLLIASVHFAHAEPPPQTLVTQANEALQRSEFDTALELYDQASRALPDSPELSYNKAVAHYRKGEYDKAADLFAAARRTIDPKLDAKARFNQGNCAYAGALAKKDNVQEAIANLQTATGYYKDAIEADPADRDARANIELAQLLMKALLDKKNQEQKQQQQDQENKDDQNQQQDQQEGDQKDKQKDEQQQKEHQQDGENQQEQDKQEQPGEQQQDQERKQKQEQPQSGQEQNQQQQPQPDQAQAQDPQQSQSKDGPLPQQQEGKPAEQRQLSREEAQQLLQLIRDKELQRRQELARRNRAKLVPVEKDW